MQGDGNRTGDKKTFTVFSIIMAFLLALCISVTVGMNIFSRIMDFVFGGGEQILVPAEGTEDWDTQYYSSDYGADKQKIEAAAGKLTEKIEGEGIVLLKNSGALPLDLSNEKEKKVSVFGWAFSHPVYGGTGSGSVNSENSVTPQMGLENAGFIVNPSLVSEYASWSSSNTYLSSTDGKRKSCDERPEVDYGTGDWDLIEMPVTVGSQIVTSAADYSDVGIIYLARQGGEGSDLPVSMGDDTFYGANRTKEGNNFGYNPQKHYLELTDEEEQLIEAVTSAGFEKVIVVINSSNAMELGELQNDDKIDSVLFIGGPGTTGFNALGEVFSGEINPSGRTADIFASDFEKDPVFCNFSDPMYYNEANKSGKRNEYSNINSDNTDYKSGYFVQYEEGIYMGYRYYETAYAEGEEGFDYDSAVVYPFGYGLSYTEFTQSIVGDILVSDGQISLTVNVENTGDISGKEVIQVYYTPPYGKEQTGNATEIEKSAKVLAAFFKTEDIPAGQSKTYTLSFAVEDMASYDQTDEKCYVLDAGDYIVTLGKNSHEAWDSRTYTQSERVVYNSGNPRNSERSAQKEYVGTDTVAATNAFDDCLTSAEMDKMTMLTRSDKFSSKPQAPDDSDRIASDDLLRQIQPYDVSKYNDQSEKSPVVGGEKTTDLASLRGKSYDDEEWENLLNQLSVESMSVMIRQGGFGTVSNDEVVKPKTMDNDGPQALKVGDWAGVQGAESVTLNAFPSAAVIACTWNTDLCTEWGEIVGEEGLANNVTGWYAPGLNLHRSPFGGRNFEYFSEDPLLSGKMASAVISAAAEKGMVVYAKHFALNDQESYRSGWKYNTFNGVYTWATEQTMRELYLRPFEIAVKESVMTIKYISDDNGTVSTKQMRALTGIMSSLNSVGNTWAGANSALLEKVLRKEWGFRGTVITDYRNDGRTYMNIDRMVRNGGDMVLYPTSNKDFADDKSATALNCFRNACHNILYTYANSNAMQGIAPGTEVSYGLAPWQIGLIWGWALFGVALVAYIVFVCYTFYRAKKTKSVARENAEN